MARIIDEKRYKKVTRKQVQKDKEILRKKNIEDRKFERDFFKNDTFDFNKINKPVISSEKSISKNTKKYNKKKKNKSFSWLKKIVVVIVIAFSIFGINRLSKMFVKDEEVVVQTGINNEKTVTLVQNYNFKIGMFKLDTIDYFKSKNIILNELRL